MKLQDGAGTNQSHDKMFWMQNGITGAAITFLTILFTTSFWLIPTAMASKLNEDFGLFWNKSDFI